MSEEARQVVAAVEAAMKSFASAERARDAERLIAHFAPVADFHMYNDGQRVTYEAMTAGVRQVLGPEAALVSAAFRETVVDGSGATTRTRGAASWLWRRIDGQWRIVYGHVDHYPE